MKHCKLVEFVKFVCQDPLHERKASPNKHKATLLTTFWRRFCEDVLPMFVIYGSAFSVMTRLKSDIRNGMADETCMPACLCRLGKLKGTLTLKPKPKNKKLFCYFVGVLCIFCLQKICVSRKQTNRKLKNYPRIKYCFRRAAKIGY